MKKIFNLAVIFAALATALSFNSCTKDDTAASISIHFNQSGKFSSGDIVVGTITSADENLETVQILNNAGSAIKTISSFSGNSEVTKGTDGVYVFNINGLADGSYRMIATSKTGREEAGFTVGTQTPEPPIATPLTSATTFTLGRPATSTNPATMYGLTYSSNVNATTAAFTGNFEILTKAEYDAITTKEALEKAFDGGGEGMLHVQSDNNFEAVYLVVQDGSTLQLHLVEMTNLQFNASNNVASFTEKH